MFISNPVIQNVFTRFSLVVIALLLISCTKSICYVQITFTKSCILISSCSSEDEIKFVESLSISDISQENCSYQNLQFSFNSTNCETQLEGLSADEINLNKQNDSLISDFKKLGFTLQDSQEETPKSIQDPLGQMQRASLNNCDLENNLDLFNALNYKKEDNSVEFIKKEIQEVFIII